MADLETEWDEAACLRLVRRGDEDAARELVGRLHPLVAKLVRAHLPRRTPEEDLMQMVFAKVFSKLDQFSGQVPLAHWVSRIAVNTCINELEKQRVRPELRWADLSEDEEAVRQNLAKDESDLGASDSVASRELVERMLALLNVEDRLVITLMHLEGRSVEEVRQVTGWSIPLVKVRAFRARQKLKKHLDQLLSVRTD